MADSLRINRALPKGVLPRPLENAWSAIWDNFVLLKDLVRYQDVSITPVVGTNVVTHGLGRAPRRWSVIRAVYVSTIYETAANDTELTLYVVAVGASPELVVRVW